LALTRGLQGKAYGYVDPNEDVAGAVVGDRAALLVVADGHRGRATIRLAMTEEGHAELLATWPYEKLAETHAVLEVAGPTLDGGAKGSGASARRSVPSPRNR
jgi:hypothetical protein